MRAEHQRNADYWNETAAWYGERDEDENVEFLRGGGSYLQPNEREILGDIRSKTVVHLQCSHGNDLLSILGEGAREGIGVDITERLIAVARRKAEKLGANCRFVLSDVLDTPHEYDGVADIVYTGNGGICWMADIDAWARVITRLLKPGGTFVVHDSHPMDWVWNEAADSYQLDEEHGDYFSDKPREKLFSKSTEAAPQYRQWTLAQIVNSLIDAGLAMERLMEYPKTFWNQFPNIPPDTLRRLPHTFGIRAVKPS